MHAAERYDGVVEKYNDSCKELDATREEARIIASRFEEVKKTRMKLFQVWCLFTAKD